MSSEHTSVEVRYAPPQNVPEDRTSSWNSWDVDQQRLLPRIPEEHSVETTSHNFLTSTIV